MSMALATIPSGRSYTVWNNYTGQPTFIECATAYFSDRIRYGDARQSCTARVFANAFISATYVLNGRKVMLLILEWGKKIMI